MWFTALKVDVIATFQEQPKEFAISVVSMHDLTALQKMYFVAKVAACREKAYSR